VQFEATKVDPVQRRRRGARLGIVHRHHLDDLARLVPAEVAATTESPTLKDSLADTSR
jgi:hypothetical protein